LVFVIHLNIPELDGLNVGQTFGGSTVFDFIIFKISQGHSTLDLQSAVGIIYRSYVSFHDGHFSILSQFFFLVGGLRRTGLLAPALKVA
jgi:hypothetical protein